eukprot:4231268-Lingulodinium_polyedra.AAC.1
MDGWMDGWMDGMGWDGWMDGWKLPLFAPFYPKECLATQAQHHNKSSDHCQHDQDEGNFMVLPCELNE